MIRRLILGAAMAGLMAPAYASEPKTGEAVTYFTLENGMEVVVVEDHRAPAVQQMVWYRAGSADEPKGVSGIAHFLEHLMFKATDSLESGEFSSTVAANGGRDNAFTSYDYTAYFQRVAADRLDLMMEMEADRMQNIRITPEDIISERGVILEERNQRTDNSPGALFNEQMSAAQYLNHRYGVPIIGWRHEMEQLDLDDAMDFYDRFYAPNNAILVVSGDVTPDEVRTLAEKHYGGIPANPDLKQRVRTEEPPQMAERRLIFRDARVAQPYVARSYLAQERDPGAQEDAAALTLLAAILGGGTTSVFAEKLQFETQVATYTTAYYRGSTLDDTSFDVVAVPAQGVSLQEAEDALDVAIADFMKTGVDAAQLDRIKLQIRADQIYARDNAERVANRYGQALAIGLSVEDVQDWPNLLEAVTEEDILAAAEQVFDKRRSVTGWLMKEEVAE
ncbi:MAG: pitrilysin family protein [Pseudomonadota bacterium]